METILTAEQFLRNYKDKIGLRSQSSPLGSEGAEKEAMIEFAKMHVEADLKEVSDKAKNNCKDCSKSLEDCSCIEDVVNVKNGQKQHLIDIMKDDEELGMYEEETAEEAAQSYAKTVSQNHTSHMLGFLNGAKWAQENRYSEEEVLRIITSFKDYLSFGDEVDEIKWFEQFKNK
jgi:hypothetical protein